MLLDRKSTRLNSSHTLISYAVFCLKKKKKNSKDNAITSIQKKITHSKNTDQLTVRPPTCSPPLSYLSPISITLLSFSFFFLMIRRPPKSTLFPSPPLSRSAPRAAGAGRDPPAGVLPAPVGLRRR